MSECQLQSLADASIELSFSEKISRSIRLHWSYLLKRLTRERVTKSIQRRWSSLRARVGLAAGKKPTTGLPCAADRIGDSTPDSKSSLHILNLQPGELVRVKSFEEIKNTLDSEGKFQGLYYTTAMDKYCGKTLAVFKRVDLAFDERRWKLSKIKNVVLLTGAYCDGNVGADKEWDGCDRSCFIWWKEGWLERISG